MGAKKQSGEPYKTLGVSLQWASIESREAVILLVATQIGIKVWPTGPLACVQLYLTNTGSYLSKTEGK